MRRSAAVVLAIVVVGVLAATAAAQFGARVPRGSYSRTCTNETMIGSVLTAECKDQNGETIRTRLYIGTCVGDIANVFGELVCESRRLPAGSYTRTCTACRAEGSSLQCTCRDIKQQPIRTTLDLSSCEWRRDIYNKDGHLQCD
jgi:hypothetical protein